MTTHTDPAAIRAALAAMRERVEDMVLGWRIHPDEVIPLLTVAEAAAACDEAFSRTMAWESDRACGEAMYELSEALAALAAGAEPAAAGERE